MEEDWLTTVQESLGILRESYPEGAGTHGYRFGPTLYEKEILEWEHALGFRLPTDYRAFVQHIGNGGCGPGDGLVALEDYRQIKQEDGYQPVPHSLPSLLLDLQDGTGLERGFIPIGDFSSCGSWDILVIAGSEYGHVWSTPDDCYTNACPYEQGGHYIDGLLWEPLRPQRYTFKAWYLDWLQAMLNTARQRGIS